MTEKPATFSVKGAARHAMIGALVLVALLGGYVWRSWTQPAQPASPPEPMTIAANTHYAGTGLVFIAQVKGYFVYEGLNVTLQPYTTGKDALDAALEGRAELATAADIPLMFAVMKGATGIHRRDNFHSREGSRHHWEKRQGCFDPGESQRQTYRCNPRHEWPLRARRVSHPAETVDG